MLEENNILNEKEILKLLNQYNKGNKIAMEKLVLHNLYFIVDIAKKYESVGINIEELINIGTIGFMKAINSFNVSKGFRLTTYISRCIENEILMYVIRNEKFEDKIVLYNSINDDVFNAEQLLIDDKYNTEELVIRNYENKIVDDVVNELPDRDQEIIKLYFGFYDEVCYTEEKISEIYNISQSRISRIINRNLPKIKQKYLERV